MTQHQLALADVISALRQELLAAHAAAEDEALRFTLGDVEIEMTVVVTRELEARGGVKFWVIDAGGSGSKTDAATQTVRLSLHAPENFEVSKRSGPPR